MKLNSYKEKLGILGTRWCLYATASTYRGYKLFNVGDYYNIHFLVQNELSISVSCWLPSCC